MTICFSVQTRAYIPASFKTPKKNKPMMANSISKLSFSFIKVLRNDVFRMIHQTFFQNESFLMYDI